MPLKSETDGMGKPRAQSKCRSKSIRDVYEETLAVKEESKSRKDDSADQPDGYLILLGFFAFIISYP